MRQVGCVHSGETCSLSMRVGGHVGWYFSVPARIQISWDLVGQSVGPGLVDPSRLMSGTSANVPGRTCTVQSACLVDCLFL